jgi:arsenite methyltransferase
MTEHEAAIARTGGAAPPLPVDVDVLRDEIEKTYSDVSTRPEEDFIFPTGRAWAEDLGYPPELASVPEASVESFAGVANHFVLGRIEEGATVLDLGCGAGTDLLIAAQMVGPEGRAIGIDMTPSMLERARQSAEEMGLTNVELHEGLIESLPLEDESVDVVISNGVIDLVPDKEAVFSELDRVLRPGGRLQIADVIIHKEVSEDARKRIDLWTG